MLPPLRWLAAASGGMLVTSLPGTLPTLLSLAAASGVASRGALSGVRADAGAQPPLVVALEADD